MRFPHSVTIPNGASDANPDTNPGDVLAARLATPEPRGPSRDGGATQRLLLALDGAVAETVTLSIYALDEATLTSGVAADRRFYLIAAGVVVTAKQLAAVTGPVPNGGQMYFRVTTETIAADRTLKIAIQEG
jgi:hypothetical protein